MTGSREMVKELCTGPSHAGYVTYGDSSRSQVLGLGKVVVSHNVTVEDVMLVESLSYILFLLLNLLIWALQPSLMLGLWFFCGASPLM
jgi:hypothetical protein